MTFDIEKGRSGRRYIEACSIDLDHCRLRYGIAPCTAAIGVSGDRKCLNTRNTCQDLPNYDSNTVLADVENTTIKDATIGANDGTIVNGQHIKAINGGGVFYNGSSAYATFADDALFTPSVLVAEAWVFPTAALTGNILSKGFNGDWRFRVNASGAVNFLDRGATNQITSEIGLVPINKWSFIQVKGLASGLYIGVNGRIVTSNAVPFGANNGSGALLIGAGTISSEFFAGTIKHARIWSIDRSEDDTRESMWGFLSGKETGLNWYAPGYYAPPSINPRSYFFIKNTSDMPRGVDWIPALTSVATAPTKIDPGRSLGARASIKVQLKDFPHGDRGGFPGGPIDKYAYQRNVPDPTFTSLLDSSVSGKNGTLGLGTPTYVTGILNQGVKFDVGDVINVVDAGDVYGFANQAPFGISVWVRRLDDLAAGASIINKRFTDGSGTQGWNVALNNASNQVLVRRWRDNVSDVVVATVSKYEAFHLGFVYGSSLMVLTINGVVADTTVSTRNLLTNGATVNFGSSSLAVMLDDIRIFNTNKALIRQRHIEIDPNTKDLIGYWKCNAEKSLAGGSLYDPYDNGTFFGKLRARNPFYNGRLISIYSGYLPRDMDLNENQQPEFSDAQLLANLTRRVYIQEKWIGPDANGMFEITGKDLLKLADDERAQVPTPTTGRLVAGIIEESTSATLAPTGVGDLEYGSSGTVRIGDECIQFTRSGDTLTFTKRGSDNTLKASHESDDSVQQCHRIVSEPIAQLIYDALVGVAEVPAEFCPLADWQAETEYWLSLTKFTTLITQPVGLRTLLNEIVEQGLVTIWWDEIAQQIKLRAVRPEFFGVTPPMIDDTSHILRDSFSVRDLPDERLTRVAVWFARYDPTRELDDLSNFRRVIVSVDADAESAAEHGDTRELTVYSRWLAEGNEGQALALSSRMLAQYRNTPIEITATMSAKDSDHWTGDVIEIQHRTLLDEYGARRIERAQIIEAKQTSSGQYSYKFRRDSFIYFYGVIAPNTMGDYTAETAENRAKYMFISGNNGLYSDGTDSHRIV